MPQHVVVLSPSTDPGVAVGVEISVVYVLTGPDGTRAVFNNPDDRDFVGYITATPSGLDSAEVRESADVLVEGDGGIHGNFYLGRRPWTLEGIVWPEPDQAAVNARIDRLARASHALRGDATLAWTASGGVDVQVTGRRQQPFRVTDRRPKRFQVAMVSADPRIYSQIVHTESAASSPGAMTVTNRGTTGSPPIITLRGAFVNPSITNVTTGEAISLTLTMVAEDVLVIDTLSGTVLLNGENRYSAVNFVQTDWWQIGSGVNSIQIAPTAGGGSYELAWRDAWA